ncbi:hypothetical protein T4D_13434, partial [Trichinella pseudospiralis]
LPGSQYPSATAVECCEGENGMVTSAKVITAQIAHAHWKIL